MSEPTPEIEKPMDADSDFSLKNETSKAPYNEPKARKELGEKFGDNFSNEFINYLKSTHRDFKGDWWQLAKLVKNLGDDTQKPNIKLKDRLAEWNEWRLTSRQLLSPGDYKYEYVHLENANFIQARLENANFDDAHLETAIFAVAHLENATLNGAHLENADLIGAHLENADLIEARLEGARLYGAILEKAKLFEAHLENAVLKDAHLENTDLRFARLDNAKLEYTHFEYADFNNCHLKGISFQKCYLAGSYFYPDLKDIGSVDFRGIDLNNMNMEDSLKSQIKYQNRKRNWHEWYKKHTILKVPVNIFWIASDYGYSALRILASFLLLSFVFACIYFTWPDGLDSLSSDKNLDSFIHALYFSVVTMTTLGSGDIHAKPDSQSAQLLVMAQVVFGYVLLGVLISHLAVLQQLDGPPGDFKKNIPPKDYLPKIWNKLKIGYPATMSRIEDEISVFRRRL